MREVKLQCLGILLLTQLAGCLGNDSSSATTSAVSARISYTGSNEPAALTQSNSAALLAGAYQGGQAGGAFGSTAALSNASGKPAQPRTLALSLSLSNAMARANLSSATAHAGYAAVAGEGNQVAGNCGGQMSYTFTNDADAQGTREFYANFVFDNYCDDATTISGAATASGQVDNNAYNQDIYNNKNDGFNPLSISFDAITISSAGDSFTANGYALVTKEDEPDLDENPDVDAGNEPVNPNNNPDDDDSAAADEQPDVGGSTTIKLDCLLRDNNTNIVYKAEKLNITLTNGVNHVDANLVGRYYDPKYGYVDISTPTALRINGADYWPSSGVFKAVGNNDSAQFTALSDSSYQLDVDTNNDGSADVTSTGLWSDL